MIRALICGGRNYNDYVHMTKELDKICYDRGWVTDLDEDGNWLALIHVITGKAKGADTLAIDWAVNHWLSFTEYPADWNRYGKRAGYIRNQQMLDEGKPDVVIAFPGGAGTEMMKDIARRAGVEVIEVA